MNKFNLFIVLVLSLTGCQNIKVKYDYYDDGTIKSKTKTRVIVPQGGDVGHRVETFIFYNEEGNKIRLLKRRVKTRYTGPVFKTLREKEYRLKSN